MVSPLFLSIDILQKVSISNYASKLRNKEVILEFQIIGLQSRPSVKKSNLRMRRSFRKIWFQLKKKSFLMQPSLLSQISIVIPQVVLELRKKIVQESITLLCSLEKLTIRTFHEECETTKGSSLYNLLTCMIISIKFFLCIEKPMKILRFNHRSEI